MTKVCVLSWNIQWGRGGDGRVDLARTAAAAKARRADVLCLQEVAVNHPGLPGAPSGDQAQLLAAMFAGYEAVYGVGSDMTDGQGGRRQFGELILSRWPVLQVFRHRLPWPADPAVPSMQRVAVEVVVAAPLGPLRVVTTHLEYYSQRQRDAQVEALRSLHAEGWQQAVQPRSAAESDAPFAVLPRGEFTVLCGDFNFTPAAPEYARLQAAYAGESAAVPRLLDAWRLLHPRAPHPPTAGLQKTGAIAAPACVDFFFVSENLAEKLRRMTVDRSSDASDHQAITLELAA
ncbi:MAG: endonuclease/exonuclease/phosphatase family protein [Rhodocyclaceae bacterium]|nr:endonuclease/exonuclease/phosphatase family protein [Rhodocyclaceae bacterium]